MNEGDWLEAYRGQQVVADLCDTHSIFGILADFSHNHIEFTDADLHDQREANSSKDVYAIESRQIGIRANRRKIAIPRSCLIAISLLEDIAG